MTSDTFRGRSREIQRPPIAEINGLAATERQAGAELIDLGQALLGLEPPAHAMDSVRAYLDRGGVQGYSPDPGLPEVRAAVADHCRRNKEIPDATADEVMITCGANQAFVNALLTLTSPGDEVITFGPGYFDHDFAIRLAGCVGVEVELPVRKQQFRFDIDAVAERVGPRTRCVVLVSPGNPTGAVIEPDALEQLVQLCAERGLWLISDETYDLLTFAPTKHRSPASVDDRSRVVVLGSFSKVFGLAAWRVGYLLGPAWFVEEATKAQDTLVVCAPVPAQLAARGALETLDEFVPRARRTLRRRRDALLDVLDGLSWLDPTRPQGATFALARLHDGTDDVACCRALVTGPGVVTVPGSAFGPRGAGWIRFSFGNQPVVRLQEAGERLRAFSPPSR